MKFLTCEKLDGIRVTKLMGMKILIDERGKGKKDQTFFGGIIKTHKVFSEDYVEKHIVVFNLDVYKYQRQGNDIKYFLFNRKFKEMSLGEKFYRKFKRIMANHDDIYILHANIGETVVFLRLARAYFKKNGSKSPLIIGLKPYHKDLVKMFLPDVDVKIVKSVKVSLYPDGFSVKGYNVKLIFPKSHYDKVEDALRDKNSDKKHFVEFILDYLGLTEEDFSGFEFSVSEREKEVLRKKTEKIGLDIDNFVFISPEANTCEDVGYDYWKELGEKYKKEGVDVFCNVVKEKERFEEFKQCKLSLKEVYILASWAKEIVGLRSGLMDLLVLTGTPMKVIYTKARHRESFNPLSAEEIMTGFSLKKFDNVREFSAEDYGVKELAEAVG